MMGLVVGLMGLTGLVGLVGLTGLRAGPWGLNRWILGILERGARGSDRRVSERNALAYWTVPSAGDCREGG